MIRPDDPCQHDDTTGLAGAKFIKTMWKRLLKSIVILAVLVLLGYATGNYLLNRYAPKIVAHYKQVLNSKGVSIGKFIQGKISLSFPPGLKVQDVHLDFSLDKKLFADEAFDARFDAANVRLRLVSVLHPAFNFSLNNFNLYFQSAEGEEGKRPFGQFEHANFINHEPIIIKNPEESANELMLQVNRLFRENKTDQRFDFDAEVMLNLDGKSARVRLFTVQENGMTSLKFDIGDVIKAAKIFGVEMVEAEAKVAANYPMRVPLMIKITREARRISEEAKARTVQCLKMRTAMCIGAITSRKNLGRHLPSRSPMPARRSLETPNRNGKWTITTMPWAGNMPKRNCHQAKYSKRCSTHQRWFASPVK